jgi:hypothetical protein
VKHFATPEFWQCFHGLPNGVQSQARKNYELLKANPRHPSLHFKRIGDVWSVRAGRSYRALAVETVDGYVWFWIGTHADYDDLIG